jgi:hypothetical protein
LSTSPYFYVFAFSGVIPPVLRTGPTGRGQIIVGYYFQLRSPLETPCIGAINSSRWEDWRQDCVIIQTDPDERLELLTTTVMYSKKKYEEAPDLGPEYDLVIARPPDFFQGNTPRWAVYTTSVLQIVF